jgi:putative ABC transport system substrate-binding protein
MNRRDFIAGLGGAAASPAIWPRAARTQQADRVRRIGVLLLGSPEGIAPRMPVFLQALKETGYVEGRNVGPSNIARRKAAMTGCRRWRPNWFALGWT